MDSTNIFSHIPYQDLSDKPDRNGASAEITSNLNGYDASIDSHLRAHYHPDRPGESWLNPRSWFSNRFTTNIFHSIKNNSYEVYIMYGLIVLILIVMIAMSIDSIYDYDHNLYLIRRAERPRSER
jgi:hypothetical protein